jgi:hypothetical protein
MGGEILGVNMTGPDIVAQFFIVTGFCGLLYITWNEWICPDIEYFVRSLYHPKSHYKYDWEF